ncbi:MAG: c-type cytochrome [Acidobacteriota bacterium]
MGNGSRRTEGNKEGRRSPKPGRGMLFGRLHWAVPAVFLVAGLQQPQLLGQELTLPENPLKGRFVFEQKGCILCHSIRGGEGGKVGPDLGQKKFYGSFLDLAGIMWNHSPEMLRRMRELDLPYPEFSRAEMQELIAYLYFLRYLGEPGDLYRGRILVKEKGCLSCHSVGGKGQKAAPAFDRLAKYVSPLYMAQALWNHGPGMDREIQKRGLPRPTFEKREIVDLSAFIRSASQGVVREKVYMSPGSPRRGETVLERKGCLNCHSLHGKGGSVAPDFGEMDWSYSVTEIAGLMWNHGREMRDLMAERKMNWPEFSGGEMADLISFLYFLGFADPPGDARSGQQLFAQQGCVRCHGREGGGSAPDLSRVRALASTADMARIMWNHAPVMEERVAEKVMEWPQFSGRQLSDLFAYLHRKSGEK